ncbi:MAG: FAD-dependent oxidoreductase [Armatimonadota bacterium]
MPEIITATIETLKDLGPEVREIVLRPRGAEVLSYAPGQWISLRLPVGDKPPLVRAYSLATPPSGDGLLTLCFDRIEGGLGSEYLWTVEPGTTLDFTGPLGNFTLPDVETDLVFVAQYTGIVPFRSMLLALAGDLQFAQSGRRVHLVYGANQRDDLAYYDELKTLSQRVSWFDFHPVVLEGAPEDAAATGSEIDVLAAHAESWRPFTPMVCGVREFTFPTRAFFIEQMGFERRSVKVENYNGPSGR